MGPWDDREPAVPGVYIVQLEGDDDHAAGHAIVRVRVSVDLEWIASCAAVERQARAALAAAEHERRVIHLPAGPHHRVEVGNNLRVAEQVAEGLTVRLWPFEHAPEHLTALSLVVEGRHAVRVVPIPLQRPVVLVVLRQVLVGVEGGVEGLELARREHVLDGDLRHRPMRWSDCCS